MQIFRLSQEKPSLRPDIRRIHMINLYYLAFVFAIAPGWQQSDHAGQGPGAVNEAIVAAARETGEAAKSLEDAGRRAEALRVIGYVYLHIDNTETARSWFRQARRAAEQMDDADGQAFQLIRVAAALSDAGNREAARNILKRATEIARTVTKPTSRQRLLTDVAVAQALLGERVDPDILDEIAELGLQEEDSEIGITLVGKAASKLAELGKRQASNVLIDRLVRAYRELPEDRHFDRALVSEVLIEAGAIDTLLRLVSEKDEEEVLDPFLWERIATAAGALENTERAVEILNKLRRIPRHSLLNQSGHFTAIAAAEARLGRLDAALEDLQASEEVKPIDPIPFPVLQTGEEVHLNNPSTESSLSLGWIEAQVAIAEAQAEAGDSNAAISRLRRAAEQVKSSPNSVMEDLPGARAINLGLIAEAQAKLGDRQGAVKTIQAMGDGEAQGDDLRSQIATLSTQLRQAEAFTALAKAQAAADDSDGARSSLRKALDLLPALDTLNTAFTAAIKEIEETEPKGGDSFFELPPPPENGENLEFPPPENGEDLEFPSPPPPEMGVRLPLWLPKERAFILLQIALAAGRIGDASLVHRAAGAIDSEHVTSIPIDKLASAAASLAATGEIDGAFQVADSVEGLSVGDRGQILEEVAEAAAEAGHVEEALQRVEDIDAPYVRALALRGLASGL